MTSQDSFRDVESESGSEYEESDNQQSEVEEESEVESLLDASDLSANEFDGEKIRRRADGPNFSKHELASRNKAKRLQGCYRPKYRELYKNAVEDVVDPGDEADVFLEPSTLGVSDWTPEEKADFFATLSLNGRNARHISETLGTKTESEVQDFLDLLLKGTVEEHLRSGYDRAVIGHDEIPAAFEVGADCELALDLAAERLAYKAELKDEEREKMRHGDYWLLTPAMADELELVFKSHTAAGSPIKPISADSATDSSTAPHTVPSAELLHLPNMLQLAALFQTSSADGLTSWLDLISTNTERPSIYNTAFGDLHDLVVALTKRLVCASLFQASSRLRASSRGYRNERDLLVRHQDVQAAARILDLKDSWSAYWVNAPRRNGWRLYTRGRATGSHGKAKVLSYDEVEAALRKGDAEFDALADGIAETGEDVPSESDDSDLDDENADYWIDGLDDILATEEIYLEAMDQRASTAHESELWDVLAKQTKNKTKRARMPSPPPKMEAEEDDLPPKPKVNRAERAERARGLRDWRERVDFKPCWDEPKREAFEEVGTRGEARKRRRLERIDRPAEDAMADEQPPDDTAPDEESDAEVLPDDEYGPDDDDDDIEDDPTDDDQASPPNEDEEHEHDQTDSPEGEPHDTISSHDQHNEHYDDDQEHDQIEPDTDISMSY